jgi:hypothetical protein
MANSMSLLILTLAPMIPSLTIAFSSTSNFELRTSNPNFSSFADAAPLFSCLCLFFNVELRTSNVEPAVLTAVCQPDGVDFSFSV